MVPPAKIQPMKRRNSLMMTDNPPGPFQHPKFSLFYVETEATAAPYNSFNSQAILALPSARDDSLDEVCVNRPRD